MLVRANRAFPGPIFLGKGSALWHIWPWLVAIAVFSGLLTYINDYTTLLEGFHVTLVPFSLVGLALSIFLGFRNSACYDRWWEARKLWGRLINTSRSFTRQSLTLITAEDPQARATQRELIQYMIAYTHALRMHLRQEPMTWSASVPPELVARLDKERNVPVALLQRMGEKLRSTYDDGHIHPMHLANMDNTLSLLCDIQGGCERIKNTPVPLSYTELTHRIVALYVCGLPFALVGDLHALTPLVAVVVGFCFLGLDSVGSQIEDPFEKDPNDLPLLAISTMIENDLLQRLGEPALLPDIKPVDGILL